MIAFVVAGTASGVGKTTVALALMAAFRRRGLVVQPFKCGPDYLDAGHHTAACGRESRNLDTWMLSREANQDLFADAIADANVAIVEGMMGLFDGISGNDEEGSTAEIAKLLNLPIVLVLDASKSARSIAAVVRGFEAFDGDLRFAGIVLNGVAGATHFQMLEQAITSTSSIPLLGWLPWQPELTLPERYLGLHTAAEQSKPTFFEDLASFAERALDLDRLSASTRRLGVRERLNQPAPSVPRKRRVRIGVARDKAFSFYYADNLELLRNHGADLIEFSPLAADALPRDLDAIYLGGGFPELYAEALSGNEGMLSDIRAHAERGRPIYAECGGMMYLASSVARIDGRVFPMANVLPLDIAMTNELVHFGYAEVEFHHDCLLGPKGTRVRGHSFHCSRAVPSGALRCAYDVNYSLNKRTEREGYTSANVLASYVHLNFWADPLIASTFVERARLVRVSIEVPA